MVCGDILLRLRLNVINSVELDWLLSVSFIHTQKKKKKMNETMFTPRVLVRKFCPVKNPKTRD